MDPKFLKIAAEELRETELRKSQSLLQLRERINKHPFLCKTRQDDVELLKLLRSSKFDIDRAMNGLEGIHLRSKLYPSLFCDKTEENKQKMLRLMETRVVVPLSARDAQGRKVILLNLECDTNEYELRNLMDLVLLICTTLLEDEETQIGGTLIIIDCARTEMKHVSSCNLSELAACFNRSKKDLNSERLNELVILNAPSFIGSLLNFVINLLSEKAKNRIKVAKNSGDLKTIIEPPSLLPKEFGGAADIDQEFDSFMRFFNENYEKAFASWMPEIDWDKVPKEKLTSSSVGSNDVVGSFRHLEID